jgi:hypothetical protein
VDRRAFIALLGGAVAVALAQHLAAQQLPTLPVIGFLDSTRAADTSYRVSAFRQGRGKGDRRWTAPAVISATCIYRTDDLVTCDDSPAAGA